MASRKKNKKSGPSRIGIWLQTAVEVAGPQAAQLGKGLAVCGILAAAMLGLHAAEGGVLRSRSRSGPATFVLQEVPPALEDAISAHIVDLEAVPWDDPALCRAVHERLRLSGWIKEVVAVSKSSPGRIEIQCLYRRPLALVDYGEYFYLVDESGFRLPGTYVDYDPEWLLIEGVRHPPPVDSGPWEGADLSAGVALARLMARQPFGYQVGRVVVDNYGGRRSREVPQVELITAGGQSSIAWGSPPGEEVEENTIEEKINILLVNFRRHGRIDASHPRIDISVFPDRYIVPGRVPESVS